MKRLLYFLKRFFIRLFYAFNLREIYYDNKNLIQICKRCGNHTYFDFSVPSDLWDIVIPDKYKNKAICLNCFLGYAKKNNLKVEITDFDLFITEQEGLIS